MNIQKHIINSLLYFSRSGIGKKLKTIAQYEFAPPATIKKLSDQLLTDLLLHAYNNVPYYNKVLGQARVVVDNTIYLDRFEQIPVLTKDIIQSQGEGLYSKDYKKRLPCKNTSGGSTGQPVLLIQDKEYFNWNTANKIYFNAILGKEHGQKEIKLWGSDLDIIQGTLAIKDRLINLLYNRRFFNSYRLNHTTMTQLVNLNNTFKPKAYWSYMEAALELARFVNQNNIHFIPPEFIISTIGPLTSQVRQEIQDALKCPVYNQYGSREVGALACECRQQNGLHTFPWTHHTEVVDSENKPIQSGEGSILVTTLRNYSMPLIRYEIGDVAEPGQSECDCKRNTFKLKRVLGRTLGYFKNPNGTLVHSHFLVQALFYRTWIKRFQIIQVDYNHIVINLELAIENAPVQSELHEIKKRIRILMGSECQVNFEVVPEIPRTPSGKYLYTICQVK